MPIAQQENASAAVEPSKYNPIEIHHISISAGDATVIAVRENVSIKVPSMFILIDGGRSSGDLQMVKKHCTDLYGSIIFDKIIISHMHKDHYGNLPYSSIIGKDNKTELIIGKYTGSEHAFRKKALSITSYGSNNKEKKELSVKAQPQATSRFIQVPSQADLLPYVIDLSHGATLTCYCNGGVVPFLKEQPDADDDVPMTTSAPPTVSEESDSDDESPIPRKKRKKKVKTKVDDNDYSMAWILEYNGFRYFTAGDLSGVTESGYVDIETRLIDYLYAPGGPLADVERITVMKATHHGSKYSSLGFDPKGSLPKPTSNEKAESYFLKKMNPELVVVPCNNSLSSPLPFAEFFYRLQHQTDVSRVILVNQFDRSSDSDNTKYFGLDEKHWSTDNLNYKPIVAPPPIDSIPDEQEPAQSEEDEEDIETYSNALDGEPNKLPVCIIGVLPSGKYEVDIVPLVYTGLRASKGKREFDPSAFVPRIIPGFYFTKTRNREVNQTFFKEILASTEMDEIDPYLDIIYNFYKGGGNEEDENEVRNTPRILETNNIDEEAYARYIGFVTRYDFFNFINVDEIKNTRQAKKSWTPDYLEKRVDDYILQIKDWEDQDDSKENFKYKEYDATTYVKRPNYDERSKKGWQPKEKTDMKASMTKKSVLASEQKRKRPTKKAEDLPDPSEPGTVDPTDSSKRPKKKSKKNPPDSPES